jgi:predicted nucleotidyltransferase
MQQWPDFDSNGDLPVGIYQATLSEVIAHFGTSTLQRRMVAQRLARIYALASNTGQLARFIIFGSFVTAKREPNDVDIFMLMEDTFEAQQVTGEAAMIFDHLVAQHSEGASVFWIRRMAAIDGGEAALQYWQITREQTKRGIIEVMHHD